MVATSESQRKKRTHVTLEAVRSVRGTAWISKVRCGLEKTAELRRTLDSASLLSRGRGDRLLKRVRVLEVRRVRQRQADIP